MAEPTEPGWYADPRGEAAERRWDGTGWLEVTRGHAGDGRIGSAEHVTDLDYLEALTEQVEDIRRVVRFWGVVIPVALGALYVLGLLLVILG